MLLNVNLVPRQPPEHEYVSWGEPGIFLRKHDVIEIELKQKGNFLHVVQPAMHSVLCEYDIQPPITRYM